MAYEIRKDRNALQESKVYIYSSLLNLWSAMVPAYALKEAWHDSILRCEWLWSQFVTW